MDQSNGYKLCLFITPNVILLSPFYLNISYVAASSLPTAMVQKLALSGL